MSESEGKVLLIVPQPYFLWRGSPIRISFDVLALSELGYEVDLLTMPVGEDKPIPGVRHFRAANPLGITSMPIGPSAVKAFMDIFLFAKAVSLAARTRYDVIHGVEDAGIMAVILGRLRKARVVFEKHSDPASYKRGVLQNIVMFFYRKVEACTIRNADAVVGTGPGLAEQARQINPAIPAHHIFDIPSSLREADPGDIRAIRERLSDNPTDRIITYVGSYAVYQGIDLMFKAIQLVVKEAPQVRFVIIGGSPSEISARKAKLEKEGVGDHVLFVERVSPDELPAYLAASDVLLSPRISGVNTPLKLLDYLKASKPIAATDSASNRLILDENVSLLSPMTAEGYAAIITQLVRDKERCERLGREGRKLIDDRYNFAEFKRLLAVCYGKLMSTESR